MAESNLEVKNRCSGLLIGLAAGDRNGGPIRLALRLTENIFENKCFNQESVVERYYNYFRGFSINLLINLSNLLPKIPYKYDLFDILTQDRRMTSKEHLTLGRHSTVFSNYTLKANLSPKLQKQFKINMEALVLEQPIGMQF